MGAARRRQWMPRTVLQLSRGLPTTSIPIPELVTEVFESMKNASEIIDVRSPVEFAEDHIPGAVNLPVLTNEERHEIGIAYKGSPFEAKKAGASLVAANIATHVQKHFADLPGGYHPLVYCWRGGSRSSSMALVLAQIGWRVKLVDGGYKRYRSEVRSYLASAPATFQFRLLAGLTGVGKTELLHILRGRGHQVLDLEGMANHRGSLLGAADQPPQPTQKYYESLIADCLRGFDTDKVVYVEAESSRVGEVQLPPMLWKSMNEAPRVEVRLPMSVRVGRILKDYDYWIKNPEELKHMLLKLKSRHGGATLEAWFGLIDEGQWPAFVERLLLEHYDSSYEQQASRFDHPGHVIQLDDFSPSEVDRFVDAIVASSSSCH